MRHHKFVEFMSALEEEFGREAKRLYYNSIAKNSKWCLEFAKQNGTESLVPLAQTIYLMMHSDSLEECTWVSSSCNTLRPSLFKNKLTSTLSSDSSSLVSHHPDSLSVFFRSVSKSQMSLPRVSRLVFTRHSRPSSTKTSSTRSSTKTGALLCMLSASCILLSKKEESSVRLDGVSHMSSITLTWRLLSCS